MLHVVVRNDTARIGFWHQVAARINHLHPTYASDLLKLLQLMIVADPADRISAYDVYTIVTNLQSTVLGRKTQQSKNVTNNEQQQLSNQQQSNQRVIASTSQLSNNFNLKQRQDQDNFDALQSNNNSSHYQNSQEHVISQQYLRQPLNHTYLQLNYSNVQLEDINSNHQKQAYTGQPQYSQQHQQYLCQHQQSNQRVPKLTCLFSDSLNLEQRKDRENFDRQNTNNQNYQQQVSQQYQPQQPLNQTYQQQILSHINTVTAG